MNVAELIKILQDMPMDAEVRMLTDSQKDEDAKRIGRPEHISAVIDGLVETFVLIS